ncbi:hypothetical protein [Fibrobacter succinogenes]|uniref:hypothetical protein n=1 Tax=Fibrobacter succinogenes TaxID=833 RepID=UPI0013D63CED|nr:hypothetical protein [Fibrobacter succinogenes]
MFYKHWKKIALALAGFFWASCDSDTTSANGAEEPSSSSVATPESSSSIATGNETTSSSSEATEASSSSFEQIMPAYGVPDDPILNSSSSGDTLVEAQPLYGVVMDKYICTQVKGESTMTCADGATCTQKTEERWGGLPCSNDICPDYGVVQISENTYECDGKVYSEAEFHARYEKMTIVDDPAQDTSFKDMQPVLYGPPCVFDGTCNDEKE